MVVGSKKTWSVNVSKRDWSFSALFTFLSFDGFVPANLSRYTRGNQRGKYGKKLSTDSCRTGEGAHDDTDDK